MTKQGARLFWAGILALSFSSAHAQIPQQIIQQVVNTEIKADQEDDANWIYREESKKPKEQVLQWVVTTQKGNVQRVLEKNGERLTEARQRDLIQAFLHDTKAQNKQVSETSHDIRRIDGLLKLLPTAFLWTQTDANETTTCFRYEPAPNFSPPTREAHVLAAMTGDLVVDNRQHRIRSMNGHLSRDVTFAGGLLGRLKEGSTFAVQQEEVSPSLWQLTGFQVHLKGSELLFKSISLQQDDQRSKFQLEPATITLDQAAVTVMTQPH